MIRANLWTKDQKLELASHLRAGMSAGQIAERFPGRTRNAVIGLVHRDPVLSEIGLKGERYRGGRRPRKAGPKPSGALWSSLSTNEKAAVSITAQRHKNVRGGRPRTVSAPRSGEVIPMKPRPKPEPKPVQPQYVAEDASAYDAASLRVSLLENTGCKWIVEGTGEHAKFCGHLRLEGKPYCQHHKLRSSQSFVRGEAAA